MVRIIGMILIVICSVNCNSQKAKIYDKWPNGKSKTTIEYFDQSDTNSFILRSYYETGLLEFESEIINQKKNGTSKYFYPNGQMKYTAQFKDDLSDGKLTFWYQNGKIWQELNFLNGLFNDSIWEYYPDGKMKFKGYFKNGEGLIEYFHQNGQLMKTGKLKNNKEIGIWTNYDSIGRKTSTGIFENGKKHGDYTYFDTLGVVNEIDRYKNGMLVEFVYFNKSTKIPQNVNEVFQNIRNKESWSDAQKNKEISDCINRKISENYPTPLEHCSCIMEIFEMFWSYQDYLQASEERKDEIIEIYKYRCK